MTKSRCCDDDFSALSTKLRCLLVVAVVLIVLTAVFLPLYYLVFRPYFAQFWTTLFGSPAPGSHPDETASEVPLWQAQCPEVPVLEWNRFDCYPDDPKVTQKRCEERGCCWVRTDIDAAVDKERLGKREFFRDPIPMCIFPRNYGYVISGPEESVFGGFQLPLQRIPAPSRYGDDITHLKVLVEMQTPYRLRVKIYDPSDDRYEVPDPVIPVESALDSQLNPGAQVQMYAASYNLGQDTFSIKVRRAETGTVLFDTSVGALTFAHQFLQLSAAIPSSRVYGLGEHMHERFAHDTHWRTWSIFSRDAYPEDFSNLYGSHPMYMCVENDLKAHAVLLLNSNAMDIQLQPAPAVTFRTTGGVLDFYFFLGPTPEDVVKQYTEAVGRPMMPPYWALGFHLGRWGYRTTEFVRDVQKKMRDMDMPQDVIHLDKDYQSNYRVFTLDQSSFAKLPQLVRNLRKMGQRVMLVIEPAVGSAKDKGAYSVHETGERLGVFVNNTWGAVPIEGLGWPGAVVFPDFGNPNTQSWWTEQLRHFRDTMPFDGIWISANEPSNYANGSTSGCLHDNLNRPPYIPKIKGSSLFERTLCMDAVHWLKGRKHHHYNVHSLYGHTMAVATVNSLKELFGARRSLVMSRSTFVGSGRYVGHWLGDNASRWPDMARSLPAILDFSLFGIPLVGADVCGFYDDAQEELCLRWTQLGIFYPLFRNNNAIDSTAQDPSAFSEEFQAVVRRALRVRYELLPFLYTLFHHAHTRGSTVARPLFHVFPDDPTAFDVDRQFMWGESLLITPVLEQGVVSVEGYFPAGTWYDYHTGRQFSQADKGQWLTVYSPISDPERPCNLHLRSGYVFPTQAHGNTTNVSRKNPMKLIVALNSSGEAHGDLYWDDGEMRDAQTLGEYIYLTFKAANNTLTIACFQYKKLFQSTFDQVAIMSVRVLGLDKRPAKVELDGFYQLSRRQYRWHHSNKTRTSQAIACRRHVRNASTRREDVGEARVQTASPRNASAILRADLLRKENRVPRLYMEPSTAQTRRLNYWTSEKEAQLIHLYRDNSLLWDSRHTDYYKRDRRDQAMAAIADAMDNEFDVVAVKDKIKTLRDYFVKELKKVATSRKTKTLGYVSRWEHFGSWDFLRAAITRDSSLLSANSAAYPIKLECPDGVLPVTEMTETMILPTTPTTNTSSEASQRPLMSPSRHSTRMLTLTDQERPCLIPPPASLLKRPRLSVNYETMADSSVTIPSPLAFRNAPVALEREGDEVLFCEHMLSELRQMCSYKKDLSKLRIQQVLFEVKHMNTLPRPHLANASESNAAIYEQPPFMTSPASVVNAVQLTSPSSVSQCSRESLQ